MLWATVIIVTFLFFVCISEGLLSRFLFWVIDNIPLGRLAPYVFGFAIGRKPEKGRKG